MYSIAGCFPSFLPSFVTRNFKFLIAPTVGGPLSTPILISRIPSSDVRESGPILPRGGKAYHTFPPRAESFRLGNSALLKQHAHWLLRRSQRLDMCIRRLQKLAETYANTRSLPRRHETEAAYSRGARARAVCSIRKIRTRAVYLGPPISPQSGIFSQMRRLEQTPLRLSIKTDSLM